MKHIAFKVLFVFIFALQSAIGFSQGQEKAVLFTGIVVGGRNSEPLPRAYIFNSSAGRGTIANESGYFLLTVFPGDSVIFSHVGFKKQYHIIPKKIEQSYSAIVDLKEDVKMLAEVKVYPYATEELFKEAFLNTPLPEQKDRDALARATDPFQMAMMAKAMGMGASANYKYFMNQTQNAATNRGYIQNVSTALLNPLAWMNFIQSVKKGDFKRKDWNEINKVAPMENLSREKFMKERN